MPLTTEMAVVQSRRTASRVVDGRAVVVVIDNQCLHTLNSIGTFVWNHADGRTIGTIVEDIVAEFDVDADRATADVLRFVDNLVRLGALEVVAE